MGGANEEDRPSLNGPPSPRLSSSSEFDARAPTSALLEAAWDARLGNHRRRRYISGRTSRSGGYGSLWWGGCARHALRRSDQRSVATTSSAAQPHAKTSVVIDRPYWPPSITVLLRGSPKSAISSAYVLAVGPPPRTALARSTWGTSGATTRGRSDQSRPWRASWTDWRQRPLPPRRPRPRSSYADGLVAKLVAQLEA